MAESGVTELFPRARRWARAIGLWLGHQAIPPMAAALAYRTVFSIIPICIIGLVVLQRFVNKQVVVQDLFNRFMELIGLAQLGLDEDQHSAVTGKLEELAMSFSKVSLTGIGVISALTLIYAAISLMIELENAFNKLYGAPRGRSLVRRLMQYWLLVSLGPLLMAASFVVAERVAGFTGAVDEGGWVLKIVAFISSVAISTAALWVLYLTVPNTRVKVLAALYGAVVGAVALEAAKYGFHIYLERAALKSLYGSLALIPVFLLWVYVTWVVVLSGLRVSYLVQQGRRFGFLHLGSAHRGASSFIDPAYAVAVASDVARAFARGESSSAEEVGQRLKMTDEVAGVLLTRLAEDRVLLLVEAEGARRDRYVLARPAETVALEMVLMSGFGVAGGTHSPAVEALREAQLASLRGRTLIDEVGRGVAGTSVGSETDKIPASVMVAKTVAASEGGHPEGV